MLASVFLFNLLSIGSLALPYLTPYNAIRFPAGTFRVFASDNSFVELDNGEQIYFDTEASISVEDYYGNIVWENEHPQTPDCIISPNQCSFTFQSDGNLVTTVEDVVLWETKTGGQGAQLIFSDSAPYIVILDKSNNVVWSATSANGVSIPWPSGTGCSIDSTLCDSYGVRR